MRLQKKHGCANMDKALDRYIIHAVWKCKKRQFHREDSWCQPVLLRPDWLKGKQVQFLYDLVTVIRECRFFFRMESHWCMALGRQNLYEDLSARKPANRLVQGNEFPDHE